MHEFFVEGEFEATNLAVRHSGSWVGFRFSTADKLHIAQFNRTGFVFSRLAPYKNWNGFIEDAKRLSEIFVKIAEPPEIERIGVRFINRIAPVTMDGLANFLLYPPTCPTGLGLPYREFLRDESFNVSGHPYILNIIQTIQPPPYPNSEGFGLIIDINAYSSASLDVAPNAVDEPLAEMRWLKNKAFFSILTEGSIKKFEEPLHE